eukprot:scpid49374/ scgid11814/ 
MPSSSRSGGLVSIVIITISFYFDSPENHLFSISKTGTLSLSQLISSNVSRDRMKQRRLNENGVIHAICGVELADYLLSKYLTASQGNESLLRSAPRLTSSYHNTRLNQIHCTGLCQCVRTTGIFLAQKNWR